MPLAYYQFRYKAPGLISSLFIPLVGEKRVRGAFGKAIDILAVFATLAGITTSLGLGTLQLNSGLNEIFSIPKDTMVQVTIIVVLACLYICSAVLGIKKGIKTVSNLNLIVAFVLMIGLFLLGPTLPILNSFMKGVGDYLAGFVREGFTLAPYGGDYKNFLNGWTLYYWAWWISWAPFVGSFVARISRGRTIKEFIAGVLVIPALGSFTCFAVFGTSALHLELVKHVGIAAHVLKDVSVGIFEMYKNYPLGYGMSIIMLFLLQLSSLRSQIQEHLFFRCFLKTEILNHQKAEWQCGEFLWQLLPLFCSLPAVFKISLAAAMPFSLIMLCSCVSFVKALRSREG